MTNPAAPAPAPLLPGARFAAAGACWALLLLASPGVVRPDGLLPLAVLALVPWAAWCSRPGPRAFWVEWLAAALGLAAQTYWSTYVLWLALLAVAIVPAFYMALAGVLLRKLALRWPLALAAPAAWLALETLRYLAEPPLGFGWMRLGHHVHATPWLLGGLRVVGVGGAGFALAALAGLGAELVRARLRREPPGAQAGARPRTLALLGCAPLALVALCGALTSPPPMRAGPLALLVQPGFDARRKQAPRSANELYDESLALTREALAALAREGLRPDLVAWGETVFPWPLVGAGTLAAYERGVRPVPWGRGHPDRADLESLLETERIAVGEILFGAGRGARVLPQGTVFLTGVEEFVERDGELRRANTIVAFGEGGARLGRGAKVQLVPGGETMHGLERLAWVRETAYELAGYVPDLVADERVGVVDLPLSSGGHVAVGLSVCFDNAYEEPYAEPTRRGRLDLHLVASNEAWYRDSFEYEQMLAFSRCIAAATARSMLRATNGGVTCAIGPDGRELARLRAPDGRDRQVAGWLAARVPIPAAEAGPTPYARLAPAWLGFFALLGFALLARRPVTESAGGARARFEGARGEGQGLTSA